MLRVGYWVGFGGGGFTSYDFDLRLTPQGSALHFTFESLYVFVRFSSLILASDPLVCVFGCVRGMSSNRTSGKVLLLSHRTMHKCHLKRKEEGTLSELQYNLKSIR